MLYRWILTLCGLCLLGFISPQAASAGEKTGQAVTPTTVKRLPTLVAQLGHSMSLGPLPVSLSDDGLWLATGGGDKIACLWEVATGRQVRTFEGHSSQVNSVALSGDGQWLITGSSDGTARLWEVGTGKEIRTFRGHSDSVRCVSLSSDGRWLATGSWDKTARLWEVATSKEVLAFRGHSGHIDSVALSADGKWLVTGSKDTTTRLWEVATGKQIRTFGGHSGQVLFVGLSGDGKLLITGGNDDQTVRLWEVATGKEIRSFRGHPRELVGFGYHCTALSRDGKWLVTGVSHALSDKSARLWEVATGKEVRIFRGHSSGITGVAISRDGRRLVTVSDEVARMWDLATGEEVRVFRGYSHHVNAVSLSPDGKWLVTGNGDNSARLWEMATGQQVRVLKENASYRLSQIAVSISDDAKWLATARSEAFAEELNPPARLWDVARSKEVRAFKGHDGYVYSAALSRDGKWLVTGGDDRTARLWDAGTGQEVRVFQGHARLISAIALSDDARWLVTGSRDKTARLWDVVTGKEVRTFHGHEKGISSIAVSGDAKWIITGSDDQTTRLWEAATGQEVRAYRGHSSGVRSVSLSGDGKWLVTGGLDETARMWELATGKEVRVFRGLGWSPRVALSADAKRLFTGDHKGATRLWDVATGKELCRLVSFQDGSWAVVDPDGRFDAANGGNVEGLHWVVGNETIVLNQLKERYYDPGLLAKYMGFNKEPLRKVEAFRDVALFPTATPGQPSADLKLPISLANRGGGIGKVQVFVNGKELLADAREPAADPEAKEARLTIDLAGAPSLKPGEDNKIEIVTWNQEGYLSSRSTRLIVKAPGAVSSAQPELYAIVAGVSDYASPALKLKYAAKDAEDMAQALELGAKRLLGIDKVHLTLLTTSKDGKNPAPTRANLQKAFEEARKAKPGDVLVVYLAGHGMALPGVPGSDDLYCYLTSEARSTDLSDPDIRTQYAVTSTELTDWIKKIPALKQVMILDTCAAGAAAKKLTEQRQISGDQIRAIDRLKDRTGFHILMGCASDKVSFEATQYEQGLLTHALLKGMRGAALDRQEFVDVSKLFEYAADEVPNLARNIGGIQKPLIASPRGSGSFDVGQMTTEDKAKVRLAIPKPLLLRPGIGNADEFDNADTLGLTALLRKKLGENNGLAGRGTTVFVDAEEMPGAIRPGGKYVIEGTKVKLTMGLRQDGKVLATFQLEGARDNLEELTGCLAEAIEQQVRKLPALPDSAP